MCFLALSSRVTGPKMRVPIGSPCGLINTAALRSKRMIEPSGRRTPLAVRTTTAFITSPFLTRPRGIASLIVTTIVSPIVAYLRLEPPSTLMHCKRRAPELSATSRLVSIWIIARILVPLAPDLPACFSFQAMRPTSARDRRSDLPVLQHHPALVLGDRPALLDEHEVADLEGLLLVMGVKLLGAAHGLLEQRMHEPPLDLDHHRLGVLVGDHHALQNALRHCLYPQPLSAPAPL